MKKIGLTCLLFIVLAFGLFFFNSNYESLNTEVRTMTFSSESRAATQSIDKPCQFDFQCQGELLCRQGWCRPFSSLGEAGERCSRPQDCRSNVCNKLKCAPTTLVPADNGELCQSGQANLCRSGQCDNSFRCQASQRFGAFPNSTCKNDSDCLSYRCGSDQRCQFSYNSLTCANVGERCDNMNQSCCSGSCISGICEAKPFDLCTQRGECSGVVGRICAANGQEVRNDLHCCSGRQSSGICVADYSKNWIPCRVNSDCRNGFICNQKTSLCQGFYP